MRIPCCEKMGMRKGPWAPEEDHILISHIQRYGHGNWRALPKQAGLLRCGKSCRLRWINYLRPDIKRGKFSKEEVETIIELHGILGNRWSAIAARLAGRTDNEIKNFWHTHLKKHERSTGDSTTIDIPPLQETRLIKMPRVAVDAAASGAASSCVPGKSILVANDSLSLGKVIGSNADQSEEMEFWYNLFITSHHNKGMDVAI